ncbi:hypothetical protein DLREEDagrD3_07750 [Denitratisoma sp. agr-D3]
MPNYRRPLPHRHSHGFSLVEILVGVAIGLIGIVIMFQMFATWEERKRTSASGSDAQISGSIALYQLERDIRLAGYGFGASTSVGCTVNAYDAARPTPAFTFPLLPIQITDGASGAPDTITVLHGDSPMMPGSVTFTSSSASSKTTNSRTSLRRGDLVIAAQSSSCGMVEITGDSNGDGITVDHNTGNYTNYKNVTGAARFNGAGGLGVAFTAGNLFNLGTGPQRNLWQVRNGKTLGNVNDLRYVDSDGDNSNDFAEVAEGIVNLQAEYGLDTDNDTIVDTWQVAAPAAWNMVRAIRVGLLARSQQYEKVAVTTQAPAWAGGTFTMTNLDGSSGAIATSDANDWRHYRYRVYQTIVPLRNMVWGTAP